MKYLIVCLVVLAILIPASYLAESLWKLRETSSANRQFVPPPKCAAWMEVRADGTATLCDESTGQKYRVLTAPIKN